MRTGNGLGTLNNPGICVRNFVVSRVAPHLPTPEKLPGVFVYITGMDWRREEVLNLIGMYCQHSCLWDLEDPNYKNRDLKREAIVAIANELDRNVHDVEKKMHGLRTQFNREHKRYQKQVLLNGRLREVAKPTWFAYEPLEFVAKCINPRLPKIKTERVDSFRDNINSQEAAWSGFEIEVENDNVGINADHINLPNVGAKCIVQSEPEIIVECLEDHNPDCERNGNDIVRLSETQQMKKESPLGRGGSIETEHPFRPSGVKKPRLTSEKSLERVTENQRNQQHKSGGSGTLVEIRDEYAAFALYVQQELKKITNPYGLQVAKLKINQVLFEGTTGSYDRPAKITVGVKQQHMVITSKIQPYDHPQHHKVSGSLDVS